MRVDEKLFAKIQNYMLIGVSVLLFFVIVNTVFSSGIIRAGDRDILFDYTQVDHRRSNHIAVTKEEETTAPQTTEPEISYYRASPIAAVSANHSAASVRATTRRPTTVPTTQPQTLAPDTTAAPTTELVTEPTEVTTAPHTTVEPTTEAESTVPSTSVEPTESTSPSSSVEPTESTSPSSSVEPTESTSPSSSVEPTESKSPSSSVEPTESTAPSSSVDPTEDVAPSTDTTEPETNEPNAFSGIIEAIEKLIGVGDNKFTDPSATNSTEESTTEKKQPDAASLDATSCTKDTKASTDNQSKPQNAQSSETAKISGAVSGGLNSVKTGSPSIAVIVLIVISSLTVAMYFACRKEH